MNSFGRNLLFWLAIAFVLAFLFNVFQGAQSTHSAGTEAVAYSDFMADAASGRVSDVVIKGQEISGHYASSGEEFSVLVPDNENVVDRLAGTGVRIKAEAADEGKISALNILLSWFPMLLLIGVWIFFMRQM